MKKYSHKSIGNKGIMMNLNMNLFFKILTTRFIKLCYLK